MCLYYEHPGKSSSHNTISCSYTGRVFISVAKHLVFIRQHDERARAGGSRASPLHPGPCHIRRPLRGYPHSATAHHGRLRQASLPISPETAVHGGFAYAPCLRSAPSMASTPVLTSPKRGLRCCYQYHCKGCPVITDSGLTLSASWPAEQDTVARGNRP
jgi:hypothetical protein